MEWRRKPKSVCSATKPKQTLLFLAFTSYLFSIRENWYLETNESKRDAWLFLWFCDRFDLWIFFKNCICALSWSLSRIPISFHYDALAIVAVLVVIYFFFHHILQQWKRERKRKTCSFGSLWFIEFIRLNSISFFRHRHQKHWTRTTSELWTDDDESDGDDGVTPMCVMQK